MKIIKQPLLDHSDAYLQGYVRSADAESRHLKYPAVIIVPGGSYNHISTKQAESFALAFEAQGYQSFFLRYSFDYEKKPLLPFPVVELAKAVDRLKDHAQEWAIDEQHIILVGFSIGGHIVSLFNNQYDQKELIDLVHPHHSLKPFATILAYPVIDLTLGFPKDQAIIDRWVDQPKYIAAEDGVTDSNVPTFIWHTADDPFVPSINAFKYAEALSTHHVDHELHIFHHGPHGMGLATESTARHDDANDYHVAHWLQLALEWLKELQKYQKNE